MAEPDFPPIDLSAGGGKLVYDKARRTIVSVPREEKAHVLAWQPIETHGPWDGQPYRQWIRIEGSREHSGARWARVYCGEAFVRPPGADDEMLGYRQEDILRLCEHGDIDIETAKVTHWMPASFPGVP